MNRGPDPGAQPANGDAFSFHPREFGEFRYAYPVLSRRAGGVSVGVNLNPDKVCNFDCVYCQVDRSTPGGSREVDLERMGDEVEQILAAARDGTLFDKPPFRGISERYRHVADVAFSGDGEPTSFRAFDEAAARVVRATGAAGCAGLPIRVITNAAGLDRPAVRRGLHLLARHQGEIWAKLDAGTEPFYRQVSRSSVPFDRILRNILVAAREHSLAVQSLFYRAHDAGPPPEEVESYVGRLRDILADGGRITWVQVCTVARRPAEPWVTALDPSELDTIAAKVRALGLRTETFPAPDPG